MLPMPPPLSSNAIAASVCSVLGYLPDDASGISEPSCSLPCGGTSVGGASSMCSEPSRLVWPSVAVALAGSSTSPLSFIVTSACQPWRSILVTVPTFTSPTRTREFGSMLSTSGICAWMVNPPGPCPARRAAEASSTLASRRSLPTRGRAPASLPRRESTWPASWSDPPLLARGPAGTIIPVRPSAGLVAIGASAASGGPGGGRATRRGCRPAARHPEVVAAECNPAASSPRCR